MSGYRRDRRSSSRRSISTKHRGQVTFERRMVPLLSGSEFPHKARLALNSRAWMYPSFTCWSRRPFTPCHQLEPGMTARLSPY
jgi:hypothetical protein